MEGIKTERLIIELIREHEINKDLSDKQNESYDKDISEAKDQPGVGTPNDRDWSNMDANTADIVSWRK